MVIKDAPLWQDFNEGKLSGENVVKSEKLWKDAKSFYKNSDCDLSDDTIMYEVYSYSQETAKAGDLNWGLTVLQPILVNGECNMTRGHFHENLDCAEIYFCLHGEGILLLMDSDGNTYGESMKVGSVHYINGTLAHRLINTGDEELRVGACWPSNAGHDYQRIEDFPFQAKVMKVNNTIIIEENSL